MCWYTSTIVYNTIDATRQKDSSFVLLVPETLGLITKHFGEFLFVSWCSLFYFYLKFCVFLSLVETSCLIPWNP